jgi:hypothetical protein
MKPGDFFIGLRQLLGVLIPGAIWMGDFFLGILDQDPITALSHLGIFEVIVVVGIIYLIGHGMRRTSFSFGIWISEGILKIWPVKRGDRRGLHEDKASEKLLNHNKAIITAKLPKDSTLYDDADFMNIIKYSLLGVSEVSRRVEELEAEINLYTSVVLPLVFLCITLVVYWFRRYHSFDFVDAEIIVVLAYLTSNFVRRIAIRRAGERRQILLMSEAVNLTSKHGSDK